jgi:hypothetical protein
VAEREAQIVELLRDPADLTGGDAALVVEVRQRAVGRPGRRLVLGRRPRGRRALRVGLVRPEHAGDVVHGAGRRGQAHRCRLRGGGWGGGGLRRCRQDDAAHHQADSTDGHICPRWDAGFVLNNTTVPSSRCGAVHRRHARPQDFSREGHE